MMLTPRKEAILATVVRNYIRTGEPVGSKSLCEELGGVSSATIRNEMSELDGLGYLAQPHTSAGRIPTDRAFRMYIDRLMEPRRLTEKERQFLDSLLPTEDSDSERTLRRTAKMLADVTHCAAVYSEEAGSGIRIHKVELIPMSSRTALLVLVTSDGDVHSRMFHFGAPLTPALIERFLSLVDTKLIGLPVSDVQPALLQTLVAGAGEFALALTPLIAALADRIEETCRSQLELVGQSNLLLCGEFSPMRVREILDLFLHREEVLTMLDVWQQENGVLLGGDTAYPALASTALVVARYRLPDHHTGYLGLLGPSRMDYASMLPTLLYVTDALGGGHKKGQIT